MIRWWELDLEFDEQGVPVRGEVVFSHVDNKTGVVRHFAVERINNAIAKMAAPPPIIQCPIDLAFTMFAMQHRGIEAHRWNRITAHDVCNYPILLAHMPGVGIDTPDEHLIIDGIHRYTRAAYWGWTHLPAYELPPELWEPYLIDIPQELNDFERERLNNQHINPIDSRIA
jgi:hypothetical protein